jgi:hypothetical protein
VSEEWPRVRNGPGSEIGNNPSSLVEKNVADSPLSILRADILSDLTDVSERLAQMIIILRADVLSDLTDMSERLAQMIQFLS